MKCQWDMPWSILTQVSEAMTWKLEDLETLVTAQAPESLSLEFKASAALGKSDRKRAELSKDISGMANAAGGVMIFGIVEHQQSHVADHLDDGSDPREIPPEWIEQVANSNIHPNIEGLEVTMIRLRREANSRVAYVLIVPQSHTAHMASDHRYYKRTGKTVQPMEDYEVRDVMARGSSPILQLAVTSSPMAGMPLTLEVQLYIENITMLPVEWCVVQVIVPQSLSVISDGGANGSEQATSSVGQPVTVLRFQYGGLNSMPIWQGVRVDPRRPNAPPLRMSALSPGSHPIGWRITAPGMAFRDGQVELTFSINA